MLLDESRRRGGVIMFAQTSTGKMWHLIENGVCYCGTRKFYRWQTEQPNVRHIWDGLCYPCFRAINNKNRPNGTPYTYTKKQEGYRSQLTCNQPIRQGKKRKRCQNAVSDPNKKLCLLHKKTLSDRCSQYFPKDINGIILSYLW